MRFIWAATRTMAWWQNPFWRFGVEALAALLAVTGLIALLLDLQKREEDRITRAWTLVGQQVSLIRGLEALVRSGEDLSHIDLSGANLREANLNLADLSNAKFCQTTMPDGTMCHRDCGEGEDQSCPWLEKAKD